MVAATGEEIETEFFQIEQPLFVPDDPVRPELADIAVTVDEIEQEQAAGLESLLHLIEDGLILALVLQVAERGPDVDDGVELRLKRDLPHITVDPPDLNALGRCVSSGLLEEDFTQVLPRHPITALGERDGVAPVAAAEVQYSALRRQG